MKRKHLDQKTIFTVILSIFLVFPLLFQLTSIQAVAQQPEFTLGLSRNFGFSSGSGKVQGTFTLHINTTENPERVEFYIDGESMGEDSQAPFALRFNTDQYPLGLHTLSATGFLPDGQELKSNEIKVQFVSAQEGWQTGLKIVGPILLFAFGVIVISFGLTFVSGRKLREMPLGTPRNYGMRGGTICPKCGRPFSLQVVGVNLVGRRLERCPFCGKWSRVRAYPLEKLREAETAELKAAEGQGLIPPLSEEEKLLKEIDKSRYQDL